MEKARVTVFDTTLRDGEQSPGCSMNQQEKLRLAHQLDRLGVDGAKRLIEQDDSSVLQEEAGEQHALKLSPGKRAHATIAEILQAKRVKRLLDR